MNNPLSSSENTHVNSLNDGLINLIDQRIKKSFEESKINLLINSLDKFYSVIETIENYKHHYIIKADLESLNQKYNEIIHTNQQQQKGEINKLNQKYIDDFKIIEEAIQQIVQHQNYLEQHFNDASKQFEVNIENYFQNFHNKLNDKLEALNADIQLYKKDSDGYLKTLQTHMSKHIEQLSEQVRTNDEKTNHQIHQELRTFKQEIYAKNETLAKTLVLTQDNNQNYQQLKKDLEGALLTIQNLQSTIKNLEQRTPADNVVVNNIQETLHINQQHTQQAIQNTQIQIQTLENNLSTLKSEIHTPTQNQQQTALIEQLQQTVKQLQQTVQEQTIELTHLQRATQQSNSAFELMNLNQLQQEITEIRLLIKNTALNDKKKDLETFVNNLAINIEHNQNHLADYIQYMNNHVLNLIEFLKIKTHEQDLRINQLAQQDFASTNNTINAIQEINTAETKPNFELKQNPELINKLQWIEEKFFDFERKISEFEYKNDSRKKGIKFFSDNKVEEAIKIVNDSQKNIFDLPKEAGKLDYRKEDQFSNQVKTSLSNITTKFDLNSQLKDDINNEPLISFEIQNTTKAPSDNEILAPQTTLTIEESIDNYPTKTTKETVIVTTTTTTETVQESPVTKEEIKVETSLPKLPQLDARTNPERPPLFGSKKPQLPQTPNLDAILKKFNPADKK